MSAAHEVRGNKTSGVTHAAIASRREIESFAPSESSASWPDIDSERLEETRCRVGIVECKLNEFPSDRSAKVASRL